MRLNTLFGFRVCAVVTKHLESNPIQYNEIYEEEKKQDNIKIYSLVPNMSTLRSLAYLSANCTLK